jgi:hypothetical protein
LILVEFSEVTVSSSRPDSELITEYGNDAVAIRIAATMTIVGLLGLILLLFIPLLKSMVVTLNVGEVRVAAIHGHYSPKKARGVSDDEPKNNCMAVDLFLI